MQVIKISQRESPVLKTCPDKLSGSDKNRVMAEASGDDKPWDTVTLRWDFDTINNFVHSPIVFSGHEFTNSIRNGDNYKQTNALVIDIDHELKVEQVIEKFKELKCAYHISYSSNHDPFGEHRMRILVPLSEPVTSLDDHNLLALWVLKHFPQADHKVRTDVARGIIRSNPKFKERAQFNSSFGFLQVEQVLDEMYLEKLKEDCQQNHFPLMSAPNVVGRNYYFFMNTVLYTDRREQVTVEDLLASLKQDEKIPIFCPVCGFDTNLRSEKNPYLLKQNALFKIGTNGLPYINCQSCGSRKDGQDGRGSYFLDKEEQRVLVQKKHDFFVFRDINSDMYIAAQKSELTGEMVFNPISAMNLKNFFWNRARLEDVDVKSIPDAEWVLDFANPVLVDWSKRFVNKYRPSPVWKSYEANSASLGDPVMPHYIGKLLLHIAGGDEQMFEAFLNWLAFIVQRKQKTFVTFLFQGVQGTGKDFFYTHIVKPIFGERYCANFDQARLRSNFNSVFEDNVFLVLNEVQTDFTSADSNLVAARIKTIISDPSAEVERKRIDMKHGKNNVNIVLFSNQPNAVRLEQGDRRVNVCPRQETKLDAVDWLPKPNLPSSLEDAIKNELISFLHFLRGREVPEGTEKRVINNAPKQRLMGLTVPYNEEFFTKFKEGPQVFWAWIQDNYNPGELYIDSLVSKMDVTAPMSVATLRALFNNVLKGDSSWNKTTAQKFNKLLDSQGITTHRTHKNGVLDSYAQYPPGPKKWA